jgi:hypothetical protein
MRVPPATVSKVRNEAWLSFEPIPPNGENFATFQTDSKDFIAALLPRARVEAFFGWGPKPPRKVAGLWR